MTTVLPTGSKRTALAGAMRARGVDSLLFCRPDGRVSRVLTAGQIARGAHVEPLGAAGGVPAQRPATLTETDREKLGARIAG